MHFRKSTSLDCAVCHVMPDSREGGHPRADAADDNGAHHHEAVSMRRRIALRPACPVQLQHRHWRTVGQTDSSVPRTFPSPMLPPQHGNGSRDWAVSSLLANVSGQHAQAAASAQQSPAKCSTSCIVLRLTTWSSLVSLRWGRSSVTADSTGAVNGCLGVQFASTHERSLSCRAHLLAGEPEYAEIIS